MKKIRINELARECEQPNSAIIAILPEFGVTEKKTHSSSIDEDVAIRIRRHFGVSELSSEAGAEGEGAEESTIAAPEAETPERVTAPAGATEAASSAENIEALQPASPAPAFPTGLTTEEKMAARPAAQPLRPPLLGRGRPAPLHPPVGGVTAQAPAPPAPPVASAAPHAAPPAPPAPPVAAAPTSPAPGTPIRPGIPARPLPSAPRPGQIISGPRQPFPGGQPEASRPAVRPAMGRPGPSQARPAPSQTRPAPSQARPAPSQARSAAPPYRPSAAQPPTHTQTPPSGVVAQQRPTLAGQPMVRPVVPPRPDLVARLAQTQAKLAMPGQPQPRPGAPLRPSTIPIPGQPIYKGPIRPGQPFMRPRPGGGPGGPMGRGRGLHPTTPLRPEVATVPTTEQRRGQKDRPRPVIDREAEREGKMRGMPMSRRGEETSRLAEGKQFTVAEGITVKELSEKLGLKANLVIKKLVDRKIFATINQALDVKLAEDLARSFGATVSMVSFEQETAEQQEIAKTEEDGGPVRRAPVVTIMGHVDHGKTSLLDSIRTTRVAENEAGGITQHIGASTIEKNDRKIVFIDTPGHEAFTRMRARGAKVTDIVVLVVAADDGVMPQTLEAIDHARAAQVPLIVAINKIDKADAQPERVKQQLSDRNLVPEDWGGDTVMVPVSARTKVGLDLLLEMILLVADMQDLKSNPSRPAIATVLEAQLDKGRGPVATVLVRNGTLHTGDFFICGQVFGKVRAMFDDHGAPVKEAEPSTPVEVLGLENLPEVGETLQVVTDTAKAKQIVIYREAKAREQAMAKNTRLTLDQLHKQIKEGETKELPVILKADVGGSAEVLAETLQKLSTDKVRIRVISSGVGAITETDVLLASASNAVVIGFNVRPDRGATALADQEKVDIRLHTIIYDLTDEIKRAMTGLLEPTYKEVYRGRAEIREIFRISKIGTVAGCLVVDGTIPRDADVRLLRDNVVVKTGKLASLKRFKDDASEVRAGLECGLSIENFNDLKPADIIEAFATERIAPEVFA
jgi:translation initiation factor IF-2